MPRELDPGVAGTALEPDLATKSEYLLSYAEKEFSLRPRSGQRDMMRIISAVIDGEEKFGVIEAGTGTGKTFAYLIPVCYYCLAEGKRAVVSTGTKALQQQLIDKDLPFVTRLFAAAIGQSLRFALLYGKANYLCPRLLNEELDKKEPTLQLVKDTETDFYLELAEWLGEGGTGVWEDLPSISSEKRKHWLKICADSEDALCAGCEEPECPWLKAKKRAASAHLVVVNHWLAAADLALSSNTGYRLFGEASPSVLVVDEAHHFREVVRTTARTVFSQKSLGLILHGLEQIERKMPLATKPITDETRRAWESACFAAQELESWAEDFLASDVQKPLKPGSIPQYIVDKLHARLQAFLQLARDRIEEFRRDLDLLDSIQNGENQGSINEEKLRITNRLDRLEEEIENTAAAFDRGVKTSNHYLISGTSGDVCCVEGSPGIQFLAWPFDPGPRLEALYGLYDKIILTSATLFPSASSGAAEWFLKRNVIPPSKARAACLPGPFDYERQMKALILVDDVLMPDTSNSRRLEALGRAVLQAVEATDGGVLVLCTSYTELRAVAAYLAQRLPKTRCLFVQGEAGKSELLQQFRDHGQAVLVGVASFWQGVDVPGDALKTLVIARIPFPVPEDPDIQAQCYFARNRWWQEVFVPQASLAMKQGIGRLIRTETDTGLVIIADPRAAKRHRHLVETCLPVTPSAIELFGGDSAGLLDTGDKSLTFG